MRDEKSTGAKQGREKNCKKKEIKPNTGKFRVRMDFCKKRGQRNRAHGVGQRQGDRKGKRECWKTCTRFTKQKRKKGATGGFGSPGGSGERQTRNVGNGRMLKKSTHPVKRTPCGNRQENFA